MSKLLADFLNSVGIMTLDSLIYFATKFASYTFVSLDYLSADNNTFTICGIHPFANYHDY